MTIRSAESRLPNAFLAKPDANPKARRAFWRGLFVGSLPSIAAFIEWLLT